jgi:hypothetical protein
MPPGLMARLRFWLAAPEESSRPAEHPAAGGSSLEPPLEAAPGAPDPEDDTIGSSSAGTEEAAPLPEDPAETVAPVHEAPVETVAPVHEAPVEIRPPAAAPARPPAAAAPAERPAPAAARPLPSFRPVAAPGDFRAEAEASPLTLTLSEAIQLVHDSGGDAMELRFLRRELQRRGREGSEPPDLWPRIEQAVTGRLRRVGRLAEGQQLTLLRDPKVAAV